MENYKDHYLGCLLGGAIGDALGAPIEFMDYHEIVGRYGSEGVTGYVEHAGGWGEFTDDTQMLLFTAEGLIRTTARTRDTGVDASLTPLVWQAYIQWLHTQVYDKANDVLKKVLEHDRDKDLLIQHPELHKRRAPGNTCLSALQSGQMGTMKHPINNSKGCGTVMRIAPVGLVHADNMAKAFEVGVNLSALTHGHPSGYLSGGFMAAVISGLVENKTLLACIQHSMEILAGWPNHQEVATSVQAALDTHHRLKGEELNPTVIEKLGGAWVAEEALAIALLCALHYPDDFAKGVLKSVNHSGDSDSTGALTGNLLGLMLGAENIPPLWISKLRYRHIVEEMAQKLTDFVS